MAQGGITEHSLIAILAANCCICSALQEGWVPMTAAWCCFLYFRFPVSKVENKGTTLSLMEKREEKRSKAWSCEQRRVLAMVWAICVLWWGLNTTDHVHTTAWVFELHPRGFTGMRAAPDMEITRCPRSVHRYSGRICNQTCSLHP